MKVSDYWHTQLCKYTISGAYLRTYNGFKDPDFIEEFGSNDNILSSIIRSIKKGTARKYRWMLRDNVTDITNILEELPIRGTRIMKYNEVGLYLWEFQSLPKASADIPGTKITNIYKHINNGSLLLSKEGFYYAKYNESARAKIDINKYKIVMVNTNNDSNKRIKQHKDKGILTNW